MGFSTIERFAKKIIKEILVNMIVKFKKSAIKKIKKQMKKDGLIFSKDVLNEILKTIEEVIKEHSDLFPEKSSFVIIGENGFNGNFRFYSSKNSYTITFNWLWAYKLYFDTEHKTEMKIAFLETFGHEIGHSRVEYPTVLVCPFFKIIFSLPKDKFILRSTEVFCDYYGAEVAGVERGELIKAKDYTFRIDPNHKKGKDGTDVFHPTHKDRMKYLKKYDTFCKELLEELAKDSKYKNQAVIDKVWSYYEMAMKRNTFKSKKELVENYLTIVFLILDVAIWCLLAYYGFVTLANFIF